MDNRRGGREESFSARPHAAPQLKADEVLKLSYLAARYTALADARSSFFRNRAVPAARVGVLAALALLYAALPAPALDINLRGYTAGGTLPAASPSPAANPVDVRAQLQAAIDAVGDAGGGTVFIPGDTDMWFIEKPVFLDRPNVTLQGEGETNLAPFGPRSGDSESEPPLVVGIPRQVQGHEITPTHREAIGYDAAHPDQTLDQSAGPRFGLRTKGRNAAGTADVFAHGYVTNSLLTMGPTDPRYLGGYTLWRCPKDETGKDRPDFYQVTFDVAIKQNSAGVLQGTICGDGMANDIGHRFTYWMLGTFAKDADPHVVKFKFKTGDADSGPAVVHELPLGPITDTKLHRLTVQLNIGTGQCAAWLDNLQTSVLALGSVVGADGKVNPAKELWKYEQGAFQLGALHNGALGDVVTDGLVPTQQHVDWTYAGFQMSQGQQYKWDRALARLDAQPLTDETRFFNKTWRNTGVYLSLANNPTGPALKSDAILLPIVEGQERGAATGFWLPERTPIKDADGLLGIRGIALKSLQLGGPLLVGEVRDLHLIDIFPRGQNVFDYDDQNCGVMNGDALPVITDVDSGRSVYSTAVSVVYWANKEVHSQNMNIYTCPGVTIRLLGCRGEIHYLFLTPTSGTYYIRSFAGARGGPLDITDPILDNEGWGEIPGKAAFYHELGPLGHGVTRASNRLVVRNVFTGTMPSTSPVVELAGDGEGTIFVEDIACGPAGDPFMRRIVLDRDPNAYGIVRTFMPPAAVWRNTTYYGFNYGAGQIVFNKADGFYYKAAVTHHPGESSELNPKNGLPMSDDNRPHADEAWKQYWRRADVPGAWKKDQAYAPGDVVLAQLPSGQMYISLPAVVRAIQANTAGDANQPGTGADWAKYWTSLKWEANKTYTAGTDAVSADGAYYQCIKTHVSSSTNRPRPWDKLQVDSRTWPFRIVEYAGPPGTTCKIAAAHYELGPVLPPVSGYFTANSDVAYVDDPKPGEPARYSVVQSGAPGVWRPEQILGPAR